MFVALFTMSFKEFEKSDGASLVSVRVNSVVSVKNDSNDSFFSFTYVVCVFCVSTITGVSGTVAAITSSILVLFFNESETLEIRPTKIPYRFSYVE